MRKKYFHTHFMKPVLSDKYTIRKTQANLINTDAKPSTKILANQNQQCINKFMNHDQVGLIPGMQRYTLYAYRRMRINKCDTPHNRTKDKYHTIILTGAEKAFDKIQQPFVIKTLRTNSV